MRDRRRGSPIWQSDIGLRCTGSLWFATVSESPFPTSVRRGPGPGSVRNKSRCWSMRAPTFSATRRACRTSSRPLWAGRLFEPSWALRMAVEAAYAAPINMSERSGAVADGACPAPSRRPASAAGASLPERCSRPVPSPDTRPSSGSKPSARSAFFGMPSDRSSASSHRKNAQSGAIVSLCHFEIGAAAVRGWFRERSARVDQIEIGKQPMGRGRRRLCDRAPSVLRWRCRRRPGDRAWSRSDLGAELVRACRRRRSRDR